MFWIFFAVQRHLNEERQKLKALQKLEQQQESMGIQTEPPSTQSASVGADTLPKQSMGVGTMQQSDDEGPFSDREDSDDGSSLKNLPVQLKGIVTGYFLINDIR